MKTKLKTLITAAVAASVLSMTLPLSVGWGMTKPALYLSVLNQYPDITENEILEYLNYVQSHGRGVRLVANDDNHVHFYPHEAAQKAVIDLVPSDLSKNLYQPEDKVIMITNAIHQTIRDEALQQGNAKVHVEGVGIFEPVATVVTNKKGVQHVGAHFDEFMPAIYLMRHFKEQLK